MNASVTQPDPASLFPPSCSLDFSRTLQAPAGGRGFLTTASDGHFHWADGTRARFWGINVSSTRLRVSDAQIEQVVTNFARAGLNLVRLEAIDNRNCLLGPVTDADSQHFDPDYLDRLDRWIDALRRHGIYYYLDLLDFRTFKAGDGVPAADQLDRGARPYAAFDPYLIQLQKEYATHLLEHRNPYSGLRPVDDPALAMVEICNEHGFFLYPEKLEKLAEPYRGELRSQWNAWLKSRYGQRAKLLAAWGTTNGVQTLRPEEDLTNGTVDLPLLTHALASGAGPGVADVRRAPGRLRDGVEFLTTVERKWFRQMRDHVRELGLKVPVTAVVSSDVVPDVAAAAQECDFTAENWYGDGGADDPRTPDYRYYSNHNPIRDESTGGTAPYTAALRWNSHPVVIREWAVPWPNRWRCVSVPEMLAYTSLQDFDAVLLFGYQTNRAPGGAEADALNDFAFQADPPVWGLYALAGQAFRSGGVKPAKQSVTLYYPESRRYFWPNYLTELHRAAWSVRVQSATAPPVHPNGIVITPSTIPRDSRQLHRIMVQLQLHAASELGHSYSYGVWRSDTAEVTRFIHDGILQVNTPTLRIVCGELAPGRTYTLGGVSFSTPNNAGAFLALSLDGKPLEKSRHYMVKVVSRAQNTGEVFQKAPADAISDWYLKNLGGAPVTTLGRPSKQPQRLWVTSLPLPKRGVIARPLLALWMADGTWELEMKDGAPRVTCDTPGISGNLAGQAFTTTIDSRQSATLSEESVH